MAGASQTLRPFKHVKTQELVTLLGVSKLMTYSWFVKNSDNLLTLSRRLMGKQASEFYIKHGVASVFSAGETVQDLGQVIQDFKKYVNCTQPFYPIADFAAEGVHDVSQGSHMDSNAADVIAGVEEAGKNPNSAAAVKFTALIGTPLLKKIAEAQRRANEHLVQLGVNTKKVDGLFTGSLFPHFAHPSTAFSHLPSHPSVHSFLSEFSPLDIQLTQAFLRRVTSICDTASRLKVAILIDAEQTYYQTAIDTLTYDLQRMYNKEKGLINATFQCYLRETDLKLPAYLRISQGEKVRLGAKLVRGAYMYEENRIARAQGVESPIHGSKEETDRCYDGSLGTFVKEMKSGDKLIVASHNPDSVLLGQRLLRDLHLSKTHSGISFAQLMGMRHKLSVQLAQSGYITQKYMPWGPISRLIPYLSRRAQESYGIRDQLKDQVSDIVQELVQRVTAER